MQIDHHRLATALRILCADMIETAKSGHPGVALGMADVATVLWTRHLKINPANPEWCDRDRFVLSAGHGSALLYALLYLTGVGDIEVEQLKRFRQLHSSMPGHPEYGELLGIETTTGPLGQGLANAVGMAIAERKLASEFGSELVDHYTYCMVGDGCLMEGISQEAISLAGHLNLNKLICFWDNNRITIDGPTSLSTSENHIQRFAACGWNTIEIDGHDHNAIHNAIEQAKKSTFPTLIACKTIIGFGAPLKQGSSNIHGTPLGAEEIAALRNNLDWKHLPFHIPDILLQTWRALGDRSVFAYEEWKEVYQKSPKKAKFDKWYFGNFNEAFQTALQQLRMEMIQSPQLEATRKSSERCLAVLIQDVPNLIGGSADLTPSNNTQPEGMQAITKEYFFGQYIHYGIREHAMSAIMNGIIVHKGLRPYGGTFLCFSDYGRPAIRLSALMKQPVIYVMTHDSIGLGEDGPTHQPVEHLASLRAIPNLNVFRPCDAVEVAECWELALASQSRPSILALCRQNLPVLRQDVAMNRSAHGAYVIRSTKKDRTLTLVATGSEVSLAIKTAELLESTTTHQVAVVSMPCWELFADMPFKYQELILGDVLCIGIEAGSSFGWERWVDHMIAIDQFGVSAPAADIYGYFGFTEKAITERVLAVLG